MSKEQLPNHEPTLQEAERTFIMLEINRKGLARYLPPSFKEIMTDIAIEMKKVTTIEEVFIKAGQYDSLMGYGDNRYEETMRAEYGHYMKRDSFSERTKEQVAINNLRQRMVFDTAKSKLMKERERLIEEEELSIPRDRVVQSAHLCDQITREARFVVIPHPKYL